MIDIILKLILGRKVAPFLEDAIWKKAEKSKKFDKFLRISVKILGSIVIIFIVAVVLFSAWLFYGYFKGEL